MIKLDIPAYKNIEINNIVLDFNGTIAEDGIIIENVSEKIIQLSKYVDIYIVTADTNGTVKVQCEDLPVKIRVFNCGEALKNKRSIIREIYKKGTIAIGNGNNDTGMFEESEIAIAILGKEGCATKAILKSDIVVKNIIDAFDLILNSNRIKATLRG